MRVEPTEHCKLVLFLAKLLEWEKMDVTTLTVMYIMPKTKGVAIARLRIYDDDDGSIRDL